MKAIVCKKPEEFEAVRYDKERPEEIMEYLSDLNCVLHESGGISVTVEGRWMLMIWPGSWIVIRKGALPFLYSKEEFTRAHDILKVDY